MLPVSNIDRPKQIGLFMSIYDLSFLLLINYLKKVLLKLIDIMVNKFVSNGKSLLQLSSNFF